MIFGDRCLFDRKMSHMQSALEHHIAVALPFAAVVGSQAGPEGTIWRPSLQDSRKPQLSADLERDSEGASGHGSRARMPTKTDAGALSSNPRRRQRDYQTRPTCPSKRTDCDPYVCSSPGRHIQQALCQVADRSCPSRFLFAHSRPAK